MFFICLAHLILKHLRAIVFVLLSLFVVQASAQFIGAPFWQRYQFVFVAGNYGSSGNLDGTGTAARFNSPYNVVGDTSGNVYVADSGNNVIRKITSAGVVTTFAGSSASSGSADGTGTAARFNSPQGIAIDGSGNLYVADTNNNTIRFITPAGVVTTLAGNAGSSGSSDGTGNAARFWGPMALTFDTFSGNIFIADSNNYTIRKMTTAGVVTTFAGTAGTSGTTNATGTAAKFNEPYGIVSDSSGNLYVADVFNQVIRKITSAGVVTTFAGGMSSSGTSNGTGTSARFNQPEAIAIDSSGNLYVADTNNYAIRKITSGAAVTTLAGNTSAYGYVDATGTSAKFYFPKGVGVDSSGNVIVGDTSNQAIRKINSAGVVTTLAGLPVTTGGTNGTGAAALFYGMNGVVVDSSGNAYVADSNNVAIRKVTTAGVVTTFAGTIGSSGTTNATGTAARFTSPMGMARDSSGNMYLSDAYAFTIRKITSAGVVTTLAGTAGTSGSSDGTGGSASFYYAAGVAVDSAGNVYVADTGNNTIRKITSGGVVTTLAGSAGSSGSTDGTGSAARFNSPNAVTVDSSGNVYVADTGNSTIRKITSAGVVTTLAGSPGVSGDVDGSGASVRFAGPSSIVIDSNNNLYVAEQYTNLIRKITSAGVVSTIVGVPGKSGTAVGFLPASLYSPTALAVSGKRVYVTTNAAVFYFTTP